MNAKTNLLELLTGHFIITKLRQLQYSLKQIFWWKLFSSLSLFWVSFFLIQYPVNSKAEDTLIISPKVGKIIDHTEKMRYGILPYFAVSQFISAVFVKTSDSTYIIKAKLKPDSICIKSITLNEIEGIRKLINGEPINYEIYGKEDHRIVNKVNSKLKLGIGFNSIGIAENLSYLFLTDIGMFSVGLTASQEIQGGLINILGSTKSPNESLFESSFMYGFKLDIENTKYAITFSTGISFLSGIERGKYLNNNGSIFLFYTNSNYEEIPISKIGIPFEFQLLPIKNWGVGVSFFGNLMDNKSAGAILALYF